jgi:hypothetical protein
MNPTAAFFLVSSLFATTANPELLKVKSVYLLPMTNGLDQYLANQLQASGLYVVVTDPQSADAVFTDNLGPMFEKRMAELYPQHSGQEEEESARQSEADGRFVGVRKGRGMFFLVERKSRQVVWSAYERPKDVTPDNLNRAAKRVADRLKRDLTGKTEK